MDGQHVLLRPRNVVVEDVLEDELNRGVVERRYPLNDEATTRTHTGLVSTPNSRQADVWAKGHLVRRVVFQLPHVENHERTVENSKQHTPRDHMSTGLPLPVPSKSLRNQSQIKKGLNVFILDSRRILVETPSTKGAFVLGANTSQIQKLAPF